MASRRHPVLASVGALLALVALLGCAARLLPEDMQALPYVPYVIALSPWFALAAMVSFVCACIAHRWFTAAVAVACIVLQGYWQLPFYRNGEPLGAQAIAAVAQAKPATDDAFARVMTCNVQGCRRPAGDRRCGARPACRGTRAAGDHAAVRAAARTGGDR